MSVSSISSGTGLNATDRRIASEQGTQDFSQILGGIIVAGTSYTAQQVKDFYANGGNDVQFAQQQGMTDLGEIHDLLVQARGIGGAPTGEAAVQAAFKQYQQNNPNGAYANDYAGWVGDQQPGVLNALQAGTFTGPETSQTDFGMDGIYGPGSAESLQAGYGKGLGPRGDGGNWVTTGNAVSSNNITTAIGTGFNPIGAVQAANQNATSTETQLAMQQNGVQQGQGNNATESMGYATVSGGIAISGKTYTAQQVKDFYANGGNDVQFAQQQGMTDLGEIHDLLVQARGIGGAPTGDAAVQAAFKQYQQNNPNGAYANDYAGWIGDQQPGVLNALQAGTFTGPGTAQTDFGMGGIYGPGSLESKLAGYGKGLGPRGDGGIWGTTSA